MTNVIRKGVANMLRKSSLLALAVAAQPALLAVPSTSFAENSTATLEEVVVTARKREERLSTVPMAVTAFTEEKIRQAGIERPEDFIALTANVSIVDDANVGDSQVSIRGINSTRDAEATFAYVVDGVLMTNPNSFNQELYDIKQIEVLKGPQGALYGRNAVAGAILVTTRKPTNEFEGKIKVGVGRYDEKKAVAVVSGPLIKDKMFGRFAASYNKTDGQYRNIYNYTDNTVDFQTDKNYRGRIIWEPTDRTSVDVRAHYSKVKAGAINFNATFALPSFAAGFGNPDFYANVNDHKFKYVFNVPGDNQQKRKEASLKLDQDLGFSTMTLVLAYDKLDEYLLSDGTSAAFQIYYPGLGGAASGAACAASLAATATRQELFASPFFNFGTAATSLLPPYSPTTCDGYQYQERNQTTKSAELRFTSPSDQSIRWVAGTYAAKIKREVAVSYGADLGLGYSKQPYVPPTGPNPTDLLFWDQYDTDVYSVFGQMEIDLPAKTRLELAGRYDNESRKVNNKVPNVTNAQSLVGALGLQPINPAFTLYPAGIPNRDKSFSQFQPKVTFSWLPTDSFTAYATYGVGFRSGGFNSLGSQAVIDLWFNDPSVDANLKIRDDYKKEVTKAYEVGIKSIWLDDKLRFNAAVFYNDIHDYQFFNFLAGPFGLLRVINNVNKVTTKGAEFDVTWVVNSWLELYGSYGQLWTKIEKNDNRPYTEGNKAPYAPKNTANLGAQLTIPVSQRFTFNARVDWRYVGETWFHTVQDNTVSTIWNATSPITLFPGLGNADFRKTKRDPYHTVNLRMSINDDHWTVTAWGRNITDEKYLEEVITAPEFGGSFIHPGHGRTYGLDVEYKF